MTPAAKNVIFFPIFLTALSSFYWPMRNAAGCCSFPASILGVGFGNPPVAVLSLSEPSCSLPKRLQRSSSLISRHRPRPLSLSYLWCRRLATTACVSRFVRHGAQVLVIYYIPCRGKHMYEMK